MGFRFPACPDIQVYFSALPKRHLGIHFIKEAMRWYRHAIQQTTRKHSDYGQWDMRAGNDFFQPRLALKTFSILTSQIQKKSTTYSTEARGSRGAGKTGPTRQAGLTIPTSRTSRTLQVGGQEIKKEKRRGQDLTRRLPGF